MKTVTFNNHTISRNRRKPDSQRLHVQGVNIVPATKPHTQPHRLVWATVKNYGRVYPYDSMKRNGNGKYDKSLEKV